MIAINPCDTRPADSAALHPRTALARSIGLAAFVYGYPLLEMMRTCRLQTRAVADTDALRMPIDQPWH